MIQYSNGLLLIAATFHVDTWSLRLALAMASIPFIADADRFGSGAAESAPRYWPAPPVVSIDKWITFVRIEHIHGGKK